MSFADLLGSLVGDLIQGRTNSAQYKIRTYLAQTASQSVSTGIKNAQKEKAEGEAAAQDPAAREAAAKAEAARSAEETAWILLRAMIAAAAADGEIDDTEQDRILSKAAAVDLPDEQVRRIQDEMGSPLSPEAIAKTARSAEEREHVYAVSLGAVVLDSDAERVHMKRLAKALDLHEGVLARIHQELGVEV